MPGRQPDPLRPWRHRGPMPTHGFAHYHSWERPLPEFPAFTHVNEAVCTAAHRLPEHRHPAWEICYFVKGRAAWQVDGRRFDVRAGDVFITRPGEPHGGRPDPRDPNHNCAVGFDPARLPLAATGDPGRALAEARACDDAFGLFGARVVHVGAGLESIYRRLLAELDALAAEPRRRALTLAMVQALLVELLVTVTRAALDGRARLPAASRRADLAELLAWLADRLDRPPPLEAMAARIGLSAAHLTEVCRRELGRTPLEQLTEMRIEESCRRLADPRASVTAVAAGLGFCSSQYFSTVFRRRRGCSPSAWRRRADGI